MNLFGSLADFARRRAVVVLSILFGAIILVLAYIGIESSRENMLELIRQEGKSLMQALVTSAGNNLAASAIVEEAAAEHLVDVGQLLASLYTARPDSDDSLAVWERRFELDRIDVVEDGRRIAASSWPEMTGDTLEGIPAMRAVVDTLAGGRKSMAISVPLPVALPAERSFYLAIEIPRGILLLSAPIRQLTDYQQSLGIGFVVRQLGGQDVVEYVVLQSEEGIVLSSRQIDRLIAIEADPFLKAVLEHEETVTRQYKFEGTEVLEVVRSFRSDVMPSGLFRIGMSLESYHQLSADSLTQLVILSIVLFILGSVGSYAATSTRKLRATTGSLQELQSLTDEIIDSMEAAVVATDSRGRIKLFNPQAERLLQQAARGVEGKAYSEVFAEDELFLGKLHAEKSRLRRDEVSIDGPEGERLTLLVSASPLLDSAGRFSGAVALAYDITEMKRLEEHARAAERLSELGSLAAGVAHEVRNPLNAISIATQRLRLEFEPSQNRDEYQRFLRTIAQEIERLNSIIKDFLSLARSGGVKKVLVDLQDYIVEVLQLVRLEAENQRIVIRLDIEPGLRARLDTAEMKKVFLNLIQNALQSTPSGGDIIIRGRSTQDERTRIDIVNSGEAIPSDVRAKVFQPYFTTRPDGTGLGLAISRRIVTNHGGTLELLEGEPTTFRIVV